MTASTIPGRFAPLLRVVVTLGTVALLFSAQRLLFFLLNRGSFMDPPFSAFIGGLRFDASAIAWLFLPWTVSMLVMPSTAGWLNRLQVGLFHLSTVICFFLNCTDLEYYKFTLKRSTADLFGIAGGGNDLSHLAPVFAKDYWYVVVIFLASIAVAHMGYRRAARRWPDAAKQPWWLWRLCLVVLTALCSRGGVQYMPLAVLDASAYAPPAYMPLVLNTPFTVMTSIGKPVIEARTFMPQEEADRLWPVKHHYGQTRLVPGSPNVVVIILESFSATYSSVLNGGRPGYMPFLDSLMMNGLYYTQAHANGRRSIDGLPAIVASMPKMMEEAFITSPYADAPFTSLPDLLAEKGYATSFYHGGHNGTMGFDAFARSAGYRRYSGRDEYPVAEDDDGVWGIRDEPYLQFFAQELNKEPQPFFSTVFTLSSHHPYQLAPADAERFKGGVLTIHPTLKYADNALRRFFATAEKMPWFKNTLFVLTADHTADLERNGEQSGSAYDFWIPLVYYMPGTIAPMADVRTTQQIDILPTVLDLMGHDKPFFSFGSSTLRMERPPAAVNQGSATWLIVTPRAQLRSDGDRILWHDGIGSSWTPEARTVPNAFDLVTAHTELQAAIQQFNTHLTQRDMVVKE
jgi:arylsulfatase A-like enzyme